MNTLYVPSIFRKEVNSIDQFFNDLFYGGRGAYSNPTQPVVSSNDESITLQFELPGFNKSDIQIDIQNDHLHIKAKSDNTALNRQQLHYSSSIPPIDIKTSTASLENGILTVTLKRAADAKAKQIKVT